MKENAAKPSGARGPTFRQKALREIKSVAGVTLYLAVCFVVIMAYKGLVLAEHGLEFCGLSLALVAALVAGKVVVVLDKVPLGGWVRRRPVVVDVALRTLLYTLGCCCSW